MAESDFKDYWNDADFMKVLALESTPAKEKKNSDSEDTKDTQLNLAIIAGRNDTVDLLLAKGVDVNATGKDGVLPLHLAAKSGNKEVAELLIGKGADVNATIKPGGHSGETALHWAAWHGKIEVAKLLINKGALLEVKSYHGTAPLHEAVGNFRSAEVVRLLLDRGADVNIRDSSERTPLHLAASDATKAVLALLIEHRADINAKNSDGMTPLHVAAANGKQENVAFLLDNRADLNARDRSERTPLHVSAGETINPSNEHTKEIKAVVELLLVRGADVNSKAVNGSVPLHLAVSTQRSDVVKVLLVKGADVNARSVGGSTALHKAVIKDSVAMAELLLAHGADVNIRNNENQSPYSFAVAGKRADMLKLLKATGNVIIDTMNDELNAAEAAVENEDIDTAIMLVNKHLESGNARAQYLYGLYIKVKYFIENYGKQDWNRHEEKRINQESAQWIIKAAEQGFADAQYALGSMYQEGIGVPQNPIVGHMWMFLGLSQKGDKESLERLDSNSARNYSLTPAQIGEAKRLAREWKPKK